MFHIERMQEHMRGEVLPMVKEFYQSDAVSHPVEDSVLERTFADAVSEDPVVEGQVLMEIKTGASIPLWMTALLTENHIYKTSFSKYGAVYKNIYDNQMGGICYA